MALTKIGSIGINTGIKFAGVTTITTLNSATDTLTIGGPVSIAGTLTYEDVTNIDSVGLITARDGIVVGSGITLSVDGDGFFTGVVTATTFSGTFTGDGTSLTGVASTDNIRTNTNATFLQNVTIVGTSTVTGNVVPSSDSATDIGTNSVRFQNAYVDTYYGDGSNLTGIEVGLSTTSAQVSGITTVVDLSKDDIRIDATGITTVDVRGGTEGHSHSLRIVNSGITTVGFSTYFLFPSGGTPNLPTSDGAISMISFTVHRQGAVGLATQLLAGSSVNFS
tara:strand:+ start:1427 stop:2263 length:837 start_codon:yes stop_codon:yes gene_type:complete